MQELQFVGGHKVTYNGSGLCDALVFEKLSLNKLLKKMNNEIKDEDLQVSKGIAKPMFSEAYLKWVKQANLPPLTNTQHRFAEWLLQEDNAKVISQIGDLDTIFLSVRRFVKNRS